MNFEARRGKAAFIMSILGNLKTQVIKLRHFEIVLDRVRLGQAHISIASTLTLDGLIAPARMDIAQG